MPATDGKQGAHRPSETVEPPEETGEHGEEAVKFLWGPMSESAAKGMIRGMYRAERAHDWLLTETDNERGKQRTEIIGMLNRQKKRINEGEVSTPEDWRREREAVREEHPEWDAEETDADPRESNGQAVAASAGGAE